MYILGAAATDSRGCTTASKYRSICAFTVVEWYDFTSVDAYADVVAQMYMQLSPRLTLPYRATVSGPGMQSYLSAGRRRI